MSSNELVQRGLGIMVGGCVANLQVRREVHPTNRQARHARRVGACTCAHTTTPAHTDSPMALPWPQNQGPPARQLSALKALLDLLRSHPPSSVQVAFRDARGFAPLVALLAAALTVRA